MRRVLRCGVLSRTVCRRNTFSFQQGSTNHSFNGTRKAIGGGQVRSYSSTNSIYEGIKHHMFAEKPTPPKWTGKWFWEGFVICLVFAITGSSSMFFVRPIMSRIWPHESKPIEVTPEEYKNQPPSTSSTSNLNTVSTDNHPQDAQLAQKKVEKSSLEPSMKNGPWSYRIISLIVIMPFYSAILVTIGTLFGRHHFFKHVAMRMWKRPIQLVKMFIPGSKSATKKT
eukprot:TRINITY_DN19457_c0_g1_i1.p1 TRINITY_DN19457_c0_g1~~TRINITY_DN19457_c0_g1_i1.p1  ORF type:complete len:225 (+),score=28.03 TRINITY_DN19457_c0_g1_i1:154-828(+)